MVNNVQQQTFSGAYARPFTPVQAARHAIKNGHMDELRPLIAQNGIHAFTRIGAGQTLLRHALRYRNLEAFDALMPTIELLRVNERDGDGNTLMHHMVLEEIPYEEPGWARSLDVFLGRYSPFIRWHQRNDDDLSALEMLAADDERGRLLEIFEEHVPMDSEDGSDEERMRPVEVATGKRARHA